MHEQFFIVHLRFDLKFKKFFIYGLVVVLAVTTGIVIGDLYIDTIIPIVDTFSTQESEIRDDEDEIEALYNQAISGQKTVFDNVTTNEANNNQVNAPINNDITTTTTSN